MKMQIVLALLTVILVACVPTVMPAPSETPVPPTNTPALEFTFIPATVMPTQPFLPAMITPDAIQVARWREYEIALAKTLFPSSFIPGEFLCEWEILGQSNQEVYVWAECISISVDISGLPYYEGGIPAVIHVEPDGSIQSVEIPGGGADYAADIRLMFPLEAQERIFGGLISFEELREHLRWRREHPEEPPLIVVSATPTP